MKIGDYELEGEVGRGAVGVVFRARSFQGEAVALKLLIGGRESHAKARFAREQRLLSSLGETDGFVPLLDLGDSPQGPWFVMPFLEGGTLRERLARGPLAFEDALALGRSLARAIGAAHAKGIVHRDLKPENVLFRDRSPDAKPLIADLGLAKHFRHDSAGASQSIALSKTGETRGTFGYMPPEQVRDSSHVTPACDVFAVGAILYEALAGRPAFEGATTIELLEALESGRPAEPLPSLAPDAPPSFVRVIDRALSRDPDARFADGEALAVALEEVDLDEQPERSPIARLAVFTFIIIAGVALGGVVLFERGELRRREAERIALAIEKRLANVEKVPRDEIERALKVDPANARLAAMLGWSYLDAGEVDQAIASATHAIELDPKLARGHSVRAAARLNKREWDGAIEDARVAIELDPSLEVAFNILTTAYVNKADFPRAIESVKRRITLFPRSSLAFHSLAFVHGNMGNYEQLIEDDTRAIELDTKNVAAWSQRGFAQLRLGRVDDAIADCDRAIAIDPRFVTARTVKANALAQRGQNGEALADVEIALSVEPANGDALIVRGLVRTNLDQLAGALDDLDRAVQIEPRAAQAFYERAVVHFRRDDLDLAIADARRAIELDRPAAAMAGFLIIAQSLEKKQDFQGALDAYERALAEMRPGDPNEPSVRAAIERLKVQIAK